MQLAVAPELEGWQSREEARSRGEPRAKAELPKLSGLRKQRCREGRREGGGRKEEGEMEGRREEERERRNRERGNREKGREGLKGKPYTHRPDR